MLAIGTSLRVTLSNEETFEVAVTGGAQYGTATRYRKNGRVAAQYSGYVLWLEVGGQPIVSTRELGRFRLSETVTEIVWL